MIMIIAGIIVVVMLFIAGARNNTPAGKAKAARYCRKHMILRSRIPGGPDHLTWVYGPHRTPGNTCDGPEHRRGTGWR